MTLSAHLTDCFSSLVDLFLPKQYYSYNHFILRPQFLQFLEIWFEKSGSRYLVLEIWFEKSGSRKVVLQTRIFFLVREKWLTRKTGGFIL